MLSEPYADDTTIYASNEDPSLVGKHLEEDLGALATWINSNGLNMNVAKKLMVLCGKVGKNQLSQYVCGSVIGSYLNKSQ